MPMNTQLLRQGEPILPNLMPNGRRAGWDAWTVVVCWAAINHEMQARPHPDHHTLFLVPDVIRELGTYTFRHPHCFERLDDGAILEIHPGDEYRQWDDRFA